MGLQQIINFNKSHLHWITHSEASNGWFLIDAVMTWQPISQKESMRFVLAAGVPAGRMYADHGPLLKKPSYSFQMIAGIVEHTIIRRSLISKQLHDNDCQPDTSEKNEIIFSSLQWHLNYCPAKTIQPKDLAKLHRFPPNLNAIVELNFEEGLLSIQFPVRHWNHCGNPTKWQIETGPLLWPLEQQSFIANPLTKWLTPAWIHANKSDLVTISGDRLLCHEVEAKLSLLTLT